MDGVFMNKLIKWSAILLAFVCTVTLVDICHDRQVLHDSLIRLHVVGASDAQIDQNIKLEVRDAVNAWLGVQMAEIDSSEGAREFLRSHLSDLETVANEALKLAGSKDQASISFMEEAFPTREYDTFSLPAGVYHSLRIRIGEANGRNWWCVVFPTLCLSATTAEFRDTAASAGFDGELSGALTGETRYEIRFFLLDCLGVLENFFHMR